MFFAGFLGRNMFGPVRGAWLDNSWSWAIDVVRQAGVPLESSNFVFIFAFQRWIIQQCSQRFLSLALYFVTLALDRNFGP